MIAIACSGKFHAFNLAEQLQSRNLLAALHTTYHTRLNVTLAKFNSRRDGEVIDLNKIHTQPWLAPLQKAGIPPYWTNRMFDSFVANSLRRNEKNYKALISWSGMSLRSIRQARQDHKLCVLERGSGHIRYQFEILAEEYGRQGLVFRGDKRVLEQELVEYQECDWVTVPSEFAKRTFLEQGVSEKKIFVNNLGASEWFTPRAEKREKFTILYLGALTIQKGIQYVFEALQLLPIDPRSYEVYFVGNVSKEIREIIPDKASANWTFLGHIPQPQLPAIISRCSVAVHPSLHDGFGMVVPQMMSCGVPVIASVNTGAVDIIEHGVSGFVVPIRSPRAIADHLVTLYEDRDYLSRMQKAAVIHAGQVGTWSGYGERYAAFLSGILK